MPGLLEQGQQRWALYLWGIWASGAWDTQGDEERQYALDHMMQHLDDAKMPDDTAFALVSKDWMQAWAEYDNSFTGFIRDVAQSWRRADAANHLVMQVKCAICHSGIVSFGANIPMILLPLTLQYGQITPEQALGIAKAKNNQEDRAETLIVITPQLPVELLPSILDLAETLTEDYHHFNRGSVLTAVVARAPRKLHHRILTLIGSMDSEATATTLRDIACQVDPNLAGEMAELARAVHRPRFRVVALRGVALSQPEPARTQLLLEAFGAAKQIEPDERRADALISLVEVAAGDLRAKFYNEALNAAYSIKEAPGSRIEPGTHSACALFKLLLLTPIDEREKLIAELLHSAPSKLYNHIYGDLRKRIEKELAPHHLERVQGMITPPASETGHKHHLTVSPDDVLLDELHRMSRGTDAKRLAEIVEFASSLRHGRTLRLLRFAATKASEPLLTEIVAKLCNCAQQEKSRYGAGEKMFEVARDVMKLPGDRTADALRIARTPADAMERADALARLSVHLPPALRVPIVREALDAARTLDVAESRQKVLDELSHGTVDFSGIASGAIVSTGVNPNPINLGILAYFGQEDEDDYEDDENEEEDEWGSESKARTDLGAAAELANLLATQGAGSSGNLNRAVDQADVIERLAPSLTGPLLEKALEAARGIETEVQRRRALTALLRYLPDSLWQRAADVAESIFDDDESGESWIAIATWAPDPARARVAVERGLESIRHAHNEDDYHEPLLRMAGAAPDDMLPLVLDVAADLYVEDEPDRRAIAFQGLLARLETWRATDPVHARQTWSNILHRLADRPLDTFLRDFVGFNYVGRILVDPADHQLLVEDMTHVVRDVCSWWEAAGL